jgi:serine/threonine-protein kinase RsbW/stage II sporulation protein AB (anti-sigma F factor)
MAGAVAARSDWELPAEPASVSLARGHIRAFAEAHGVRPEEVVDLTLAVTEAVTNAVIHAFIGLEPGTVSVRAITGADELTVVVTDDGRGMQPRADSPGLGLGLPTIGRLAALVDLREPPGGGTELTMTFATPGVLGPTRVPRERLQESELLDSASRIAQGAWPGEGVEALVDLLVPAVADACAVDVLDVGGYPERFAGRVDGSAEYSRWLTALRPRADAPRSATRAALADGQPHVSELTLDLIERITTNPADAATMAATGIRWWVVVPLREGERLLGLLHFGLLPARGRPADDLVEFLAALGERAAAGLAHTQLIAELQRMRHRFERILDVLGEAVIVRDAESRLVYANDAAAQLFSVESPSELYAETGDAIFARVQMLHPDGRPVELEELPYRRLLAGRDAPPLLVSMDDRWLLVKASLLDEGERLVVSIIEDVTGARPERTTPGGSPAT